MGEEEIQDAYGQKKIFAHYKKFMETVDNIKKEDDSGIWVFSPSSFKRFIRALGTASKWGLKKKNLFTEMGMFREMK